MVRGCDPLSPMRIATIVGELAPASAAASWKPFAARAPELLQSGLRPARMPCRCLEAIQDLAGLCDLAGFVVEEAKCRIAARPFGQQFHAALKMRRRLWRLAPECGNK